MRRNKKIMKKIGSFLLAEMLVMTSVTGVPVKGIGSNLITAYAAEVVETGTCGYNVTYTLDNEGTLMISGTGAIITDGKFYGREDIKKVIIKDGVTEIGNNAFGGWSSLISIEIPDSVTEIGVLAFGECSSLKSIEIPNSVTKIGYAVFRGCSSLKSIEIPNSVTVIDDEAFARCSSLTSIKIPNSVTEIDGSAFWECSSLVSINVDINNQSYSSEEGVLFSKDKTRCICYPCGKSNSYKIPTSVTEIGNAAFGGCSSLTSIEIPTSVTKIGNAAFGGCSSLTSIEIPTSVTEIGNSAFRGCSSLKSIEIPNSVTKIDESTFWECSSLKSIEIPNSVTKIDETAFGLCRSLKSIEIPNSITEIGWSAFYECSSLTSMEIPASVTSIGYHAFGYYYDDENDEIIKQDDFIIYGYPGTEAERYAKENGFEFIPLTKLISDDGISVKSTLENLSDNAILITKTLDSESVEYSKISEKISEYLLLLSGEENSDIKYCAYEIYITDEENNIIQPKDKVTVNIPIPNGYEEDSVKVYRVEADDSFTDMNATVSNENLVFETDHFSIYVIASVNKDDTADTSVRKGDLNGDGNVDIKDSALLKRNLAGWDVEISTSVADLNGDGNVDIKDSALLKRKLAGWDVKFAE